MVFSSEKIPKTQTKTLHPSVNQFAVQRDHGKGEGTGRQGNIASQKSERPFAMETEGTNAAL